MQELFEGYLPVNGKDPLIKWKRPLELMSLDEVQKYDEYGGRLAPDIVCIDVDDMEQSEKLARIVEDKQLLCQIRRTDRGRHFYFKNDGTFLKNGAKIKSCLGITIDIRQGIGNSYCKLKSHGKIRPIEYDIYPNEELQEVPKWLRPLKVKNCEIDLFNLKEGDGRNSDLFKYIIYLTNSGFTKDECKEVIRLINDYILKDKLGQRELETILRDEAFENLRPNFFGNRGKFLHDEFAKYLIESCPIKRINGELHLYNNGEYINSSLVLDNKMISVIPNLNRNQRNETLFTINALLPENTGEGDFKYIAFNNGVLNLETGKLEPLSPKFVITNKIPHDYDPDATCKLVDDTLMNLACGDKDIFNLLCEIAGYCFYRRNELRKAFIFLGDKKNGKSTYISMINSMLGDKNTSSLDLKDLNEKFKTAEISGKLANLGDDIADDFIPDTAIFKKLVSGDVITAERKGQPPFKFKNYSKLIFSANTMPRVRDNTGAVLDRLVIVPFNAVFEQGKANFDPFIKYKLIEENAIKRLIVLGVQGLKRVLERKEFSSNAEIQALLNEYDKENNPILEFFESIDSEYLCRESITTVYQAYTEFCLSDGYSALSRAKFTRMVKKHFSLGVKVVKIDKKCVRMFKPVSE